MTIEQILRKEIERCYGVIHKKTEDNIKLQDELRETYYDLDACLAQIDFQNPMTRNEKMNMQVDALLNAELTNEKSAFEGVKRSFLLPCKEGRE